MTACPEPCRRGPRIAGSVAGVAARFAGRRQYGDWRSRTPIPGNDDSWQLGLSAEHFEPLPFRGEGLRRASRSVLSDGGAALCSPEACSTSLSPASSSGRLCWWRPAELVSGRIGVWPVRRVIGCVAGIRLIRMAPTKCTASSFAKIVLKRCHDGHSWDFGI